MVPCSLLLNFDFRSYSAKPLKDLILSSCLEWRYTYPLLEDAGIEAWAVDILGWGFSNLGRSLFPFFLLAYFSSVLDQ